MILNRILINKVVTIGQNKKLFDLYNFYTTDERIQREVETVFQ